LAQFLQIFGIFLLFFNPAAYFSNVII